MTESSRKKVHAMVSRLIKAAIVAAVLAAVITSLPEIKRYLEMRAM